MIRRVPRLRAAVVEPELDQRSLNRGAARPPLRRRCREGVTSSRDEVRGSHEFETHGVWVAPVGAHGAQAAEIGIGQPLSLACYAIGRVKFQAREFDFPEHSALPDALALPFGAAACRAFSRGLFHGYRTEKDTLPAVRGRICFDHQIRRRYSITLRSRCATTRSRTLSTRSSTHRLQHYRCLGSDRWRHLAGPRCDTRPVRQHLLDDVVWTEVLRLREEPALIQQELDRPLAAAHGRPEDVAVETAPRISFGIIAGMLVSSPILERTVPRRASAQSPCDTHPRLLGMAPAAG